MLLRVASILVACAFVSQATVITFNPVDNYGGDANLQDMDDLDHRYAYRWGVNWSVPSGYVIKSAELSFEQIYDWRVEANVLYVHLLNTGRSGVWRTFDGEDPGDLFAGHPFIGQWSDADGPLTKNNLTFAFSPELLDDLAAFVADGNFGIGFDPDCHYYNNGVQLRITVPDGGATLALLGLAMVAVHTGGRRMFRR